MRTLTIVVLAVLPCLAQTTQPTSRPASYTYNGRRVSAIWLDKQWRHFRNQICMIDGSPVDIGRDKAEQKPVTGPATTGQARYVAPGSSKITSMVDGIATATIRTPAGEQTVSVTGVGKRKVGAQLPQWIVCAGENRWVAFEPIERDEFAAAIEGGMKLVEYERVVTYRKYKPGTQTLGNHSPMVTVVDSVQIIEKPVE